MIEDEGNSPDWGSIASPRKTNLSIQSPEREDSKDKDISDKIPTSPVRKVAIHTPHGRNPPHTC